MFSDEHFRKLFEKYESIIKLYLSDKTYEDPDLNEKAEPKHGFVVFSDKAEADHALNEYNNRRIQDFIWILKLEEIPT